MHAVFFVAAFTRFFILLCGIAECKNGMRHDGLRQVKQCGLLFYAVHLRLYELEAMLPASFIRINKSALANEAHLERFTASFNGAVDAVFRSGYREYVSRRCFAEIKRRYDHV